MKLADKVIAVTGASSGIGRGIAEVAAKHGAKVIVADINEEAGAEVVAGIEANGGQATFVRIDVSAEEDAQKLVDASVATFGRLDGAVNNAGIAGAQVELIDTDTELWDRTMNINLRGMFFMVRAQMRHFKDNGGGVIVNTSSMSAFTATKNVTSYAVSKWGVRGLTVQAAVEGIDYGIRVNALSPGVVKTAIFDDTPPEQMAAFEAMQPGGRFGTPEEMGEIAAFLLSDESSYVNGHVLAGDMGATAF